MGAWFGVLAQKKNPPYQSSGWLRTLAGLCNSGWLRTLAGLCHYGSFLTTCRELRFERRLSHKTFNSTLLKVLTMFKYFIENIFLWNTFVSFLNWKWPELMRRGQNIGKKWRQREPSCSENGILFRIPSVCLSLAEWPRLNLSCGSELSLWMGAYGIAVPPEGYYAGSLVPSVAQLMY